MNEESDTSDDPNGESGACVLKFLLDRLSTRPEKFHLECSVGVALDDAIVRRTILLTCWCRWDTPLSRQGKKNTGVGLPLRITDCTCDATTDGQPQNPKHILYQEACLQLLRALISEFQRLASTQSDTHRNRELSRTFLNVVESSLLQCCRLDTELVSLCTSFFNSARDCTSMTGCPVYFNGASGPSRLERKLLEWIGVSSKTSASPPHHDLP